MKTRSGEYLNVCSGVQFVLRGGWQSAGMGGAKAKPWGWVKRGGGGTLSGGDEVKMGGGGTLSGGEEVKRG